MKTYHLRATVGLTLTLLAAATPRVAVADTAFTYQGELTENGVPASGAFDIEFSLWDAQDGGNQICCPVVVNDVEVFEGRFTAQLDFGADAFDNQGRWLELIVGGFTLSPRQPITRSPYAIQTRGIFVDENNNVGIGTSDPQRQLDVVAHDAALRLSSTNTETELWSRIEFQTANATVPGGGGSQARPVGSIEFKRPDGSTSSAIHATQSQTQAVTEGFMRLEVDDETKLAISSHEVSANVFLDASDGIRGSSNDNTPAVDAFASPLFPTSPTIGVRAVNQSQNDMGYGLYASHAGDGYAGYFEGGRSYFEGQVGIGAEDPQAQLNVANGSRTRGLQVKHAVAGGAAAVIDASAPAIYGLSVIGTASQLSLYVSNSGEGDAASFFGDVVMTGGNVGIGTDESLFPLQVVSNDERPAIAAVNQTSGPVLYALGPGTDGLIYVGELGGSFLSIDGNEVSARAGPFGSTLYLNKEGGDIVCGGAIDIEYTIVSGENPAQCPTGTNVVGGGCKITGDAEIRESYPSGNSWHCGAGDVIGFATLDAFAICAGIK